MNKLLCILKTILTEIKATAMLQGPNDKPGLGYQCWDTTRLFSSSTFYTYKT